jgi:hypothetical protein
MRLVYDFRELSRVTTARTGVVGVLQNLPSRQLGVVHAVLKVQDQAERQAIHYQWSDGVPRARSLENMLLT